MASPKRLNRLVKNLRDSELIITPKLDKWLLNHDGLELNDEFANLLVEQVTFPAPSRNGRFGASSRGTCPRAQIYTYLGVPGRQVHDSVQMNLFMDGTWRHLRWQMLLLQAGLLTEIEVPVEYSPLNVQGLMDGEGVDDHGDSFGFELKGTSSFHMVSSGEMFPQHRRQVHTYWLARPDLKKFIIIYECKQTQQWKEFVIEKDDRIMREVKKELELLNAAIDNRKVPAQNTSCKEKEGRDYKSCPFQEHCFGTFQSYKSSTIVGERLRKGEDPWTPIGVPGTRKRTRRKRGA
tara:strand:+ start:426 stop:1301 length:876 start_codon:yes stop_codon:yes gene_type:complete